MLIIFVFVFPRWPDCGGRGPRGLLREVQDGGGDAARDAGRRHQHARHRPGHVQGRRRRGGGGRDAGRRRRLPAHRHGPLLRQRARGGARGGGQDRRGRRHPGGHVPQQQALEHGPPARPGGGRVPADAGRPGHGLPGPVPHALPHRLQGRRRAGAARRRRPGALRRRRLRGHVPGHGGAGGQGPRPLHRREQLQLGAAPTPARQLQRPARRQPGRGAPAAHAGGARQPVPGARRTGGGAQPARGRRPPGARGRRRPGPRPRQDPRPGPAAVPVPEGRHPRAQDRHQVQDGREPRHLRLRAVHRRGGRARLAQRGRRRLHVPRGRRPPRVPVRRRIRM